MKARRVVPKKSLMKVMQENLVLGLLSITPLFITLWILLSVVSSLDTAFYSTLPRAVTDWQNQGGWRIPGVGIVATFLLLQAAGLLARTFLGDWFQRGMESMLLRVPVVNSLYGVLKQMSKAFFSSDSKENFKKVVWIPFPSRETRTLAFLSGHLSNKESLVFVPTAPNPTSGYVLAVKDSDIEDSTYTVEEGLKIVISCGAMADKHHG